MAKHHLTGAGQLYFGDGYQGGLASRNDRHGAEFMPITKIDLGSPIIADTNALIVAATTTELPDTETVTYTFPAVSASPQDGANLTGILDFPRNITCLTTHGSSIVAMTVLITGLDEFGETMTETITIAATGTSEVDVGLKAFKSLTTIAITAVADAEANTLNMGFGDVLGLPYKLEGEFDVLAQYADTTEEKLASVWVAADATDPATDTTGDVRGTVVPDTTLNGTVNFIVWMKVADPATRTGLVGVPQV